MCWRVQVEWDPTPAPARLAWLQADFYPLEPDTQMCVQGLEPCEVLNRLWPLG